MKTMHRFFCIIAAFIMAISFVGCNGSTSKAENGDTDINETDIEVWSAPITEKIMQDQYDIYSSVKSTSGLKVSAVRNEYESAQLIITAQKDISSFDFSVNDLQREDGEVFESENISVYLQKYIPVVQVTHGNNAPSGNYPDALLPFEVAKEYRENIVAEGMNQGLWITFYVPEGTEAGEYNGQFALTIGDLNISVPVSLTVYDFEISNVNHARSYFHNSTLYMQGELDTTQDMYEKYAQALIEYRLSPSFYQVSTTSSDADIEEFAELAYKYGSMDAVSTISIPYTTTYIDGVACFDPAVFKKYIRALVEKSVENNYDLLSKAIFYCAIIDEPFFNTAIRPSVPVVCREFDKAIDELATECMNNLEYPQELREQIAESIRKIPNIVTDYYEEEFDGVIDTWCPKFNHYDTEADRAQYAEQQEKWWYGCNEPIYPYPSYHIEDSLVTARLINWMMKDYDIVGNLYWSATYMVQFSYEYAGSVAYLEDPYDTAMRCANTNGEGFLFYPGKQYGIDGPVATTRIHAIRDGQEEYEILYELDKIYNSIGEAVGANYSIDSILDVLTSKLYAGTKVYTTSQAYMQARETLMSLAEVAASEAQISIVDAQEESGVWNFEITAKSDCDLTVNGENIAATSEKNGISVYEITQELGAGENILSISADKGGKTVGEISLYLGGGRVIYPVEEMQNSYTGDSITNKAVEEIDGDSALNISLDAVAYDETQIVVLSDDFLAEIGADTDKMVLKLYNPTSDGILIDIGFKYTKRSTVYSVFTGILQPGWNVIEITNLYGYNWLNYGNVDSVYYYIGEQGDSARSIGFGEIEVYGG